MLINRQLRSVFENIAYTVCMNLLYGGTEQNNACSFVIRLGGITTKTYQSFTFPLQIFPNKIDICKALSRVEKSETQQNFSSKKSS